MFCKECGTKIPEGGAFCPQCGTMTDSPAVEMPAADTAIPETGKASAVSSVMGNVTERINKMAGGSGSVELKFGDFFKEAFKRHSRGEANEIFACGTPSTTPAISEVATEWPKPWLWSRVLLVLAATFAGLVALYQYFGNPLALPGVIFMGALLVDFSLLVFFFETNAPRNVSITEAVKMFFIGGVASLLAVMMLHKVIPGAGTGAIDAALLTGLIEELAKILIVAFFMSRAKGRVYVLNGLLIGAAVGAGFSVFENAGYAFSGFLDNFIAAYNYAVQNNAGEAFIYNYGYQAIMDSTSCRLLGNLGGHAAWAAVEGAALALCAKGDKFEWNQLSNPRFLAFAAICVVFHGLWDAYVPYLADIAVPFVGSLKGVLLIVAVWVVIAVMLNRGLAQINEVASEAVDEKAARGVTPGAVVVGIA